MCLIALKRNEEQKMDFIDFQNAVDNNPDGTGLMYPKAGRIITKKLGNPTYRENREMFQEWLDQPLAALHVRIATGKSKINTINAHPFEILRKDRDGVDLWMMHNGIIGKANILNEEMSDTWHFVNFYLRPLLSRNVYALCNPFIQQMLKEFVGSSRLVFMYGDGTSIIIDADNSGHESDKHGGLWFSNRHSLTKRPVYEAPKSYSPPMLQKDYHGYGAGFTEYGEDTQDWFPAKDKKGFSSQEEYEESWIEKAVATCFRRTDPSESKEEPVEEIIVVDKFDAASSLDDILDAISDLSQVEIQDMVKDKPEMVVNVLACIKDYHLDDIFEDEAETAKQ